MTCRWTKGRVGHYFQRFTHSKMSAYHYHFDNFIGTFIGGFDFDRPLKRGKFSRSGG